MTSMPPTAPLSWAGGAPRELLPCSALAVLSDTHGAGDTGAESFPCSSTSHSHAAPTRKAGWAKIPVRFGLSPVSQQMNTQQDTATLINQPNLH